MTPEELERVSRIIDSITLSAHNAKTSIVNAEEGHVVCEPKRTGVVIMAFGPTSKDVTLFQHDPAWEIWGLNNGYYNATAYDANGVLRADRWFEIHEMHAQPSDDLIWMNKCPVPLYVADLKKAREYGPMLNAVQFPRDRLQREIGIGSWWACTFAYQIALAMYEGFTKIALLGMEFGSPREWLMERPNVLWWAGYAAGRGIEVIMPKDSTFMEHPYAYGMHYDHEKLWCERRIENLMQQWGYALTAQGKAEQDAYHAGLQAALPEKTPWAT